MLEASGYPPASHDGKALLNILDTLPARRAVPDRREAAAGEWTQGILDLETRPRVRVFARVDRFDRFVSVLVYVPRDRYTSMVRERIGALLAETYDGRIAAFYPSFHRRPAGAGAVHRRALRRPRRRRSTPPSSSSKIVEIIRTWDDRLVECHLRVWG